jgi:toxin HigB-1
MPIRTFKNKKLENLFFEGDGRGLPQKHLTKLVHLLDALNCITHLDEMRHARVHPLRGARAGTYSIPVTRNWRLTFGFEKGFAESVDFEDYH